MIGAKEREQHCFDVLDRHFKPMVMDECVTEKKVKDVIDYEVAPVVWEDKPENDDHGRMDWEVKPTAGWPYKYYVKGHTNVKESMVEDPLSYSYDSDELRKVKMENFTFLKIFNEADRNVNEYMAMWSAFGKPDCQQDMLEVQRKLKEIELGRPDIDPACLCNTFQATHFGGSGRLATTEEIVELFREFAKRDCAGIQTIPYHVKGEEEEFVIDIPFFYLLSQYARDHLNHAIETMVWWKRCCLFNFGENFYGDKIRVWLYANFYKALPHPTAWLCIKEQWWYKRLYGNI